MDLQAKGAVDFTPSHLREHQVLGLQVTDHYTQSPYGLVIVRVTD